MVAGLRVGEEVFGCLSPRARRGTPQSDSGRFLPLNPPHTSTTPLTWLCRHIGRSGRGRALRAVWEERRGKPCVKMRARRICPPRQHTNAGMCQPRHEVVSVERCTLHHDTHRVGGAKRQRGPPIRTPHPSLPPSHTHTHRPDPRPTSTPSASNSSPANASLAGVPPARGGATIGAPRRGGTPSEARGSTMCKEEKRVCASVLYCD